MAAGSATIVGHDVGSGGASVARGGRPGQRPSPTAAGLAPVASRWARSTNARSARAPYRAAKAGSGDHVGGHGGQRLAAADATGPGHQVGVAVGVAEAGQGQPGGRGHRGTELG